MFRHRCRLCNQRRRLVCLTLRLVGRHRFDFSDAAVAGLWQHIACAAQCVDQYFVKYAATAVALLVYAAPLWLRDAGQRGSRDDLTQDYIRAMRLLQNTSRCGSRERDAM